MKPITFLATRVAVIMVSLISPMAMAAAGDSYVYRVINGYNRETVGHVRQTDTPATTAQGQVLAVTVDTPALGTDRTEMYAAQGQWLRRPLDNHGRPVDYEFGIALPAVPAQAGTQSWSTRVPAKVAGEPRSRSVRVDGRVLGEARIRVPAGEFETLKIQRIIYAGDADFSITETRITEIDWYSPSLGRSIRTETRSDWRDMRSGCRRPEQCDYRGDWHIFELAEVTRANP
jgi:hypothetical protein